MKKILLTIALIFALVLATGCQTENPDPNEGTMTSDKYDWKTPQTDKLKLTETWENKDFIKDGIGVVTPVRYVDGDTTIFKASNGENITVRYNGINTPESTYRIEAWGFAASKYNKTAFKEALEQGAKIVLSTESMSERFDSTGKRYLAWIWFAYPNGDTRLLNLELAELAYAQVKSASDTKYAKQFTDAIYDVSLKRLRVYGEVDPDYDYSTDAKAMSIREIRETYGTEDAINASKEGFTSPLIKVSGVVVRKNGTTNAYIQQYDVETDKYYGIYVYGGYNAINKLIEGAHVEITAKIGYYYGSLQITDLTSDSKIKVYSFDKETVNIQDETCDEVNNIYAYEKIGTLVRIKNLTVTGFKDADNTSATTIYCTYTANDGSTKKLNIRVDQNVTLTDPVTNQQILSGAYFNGKTIESLVGVVCIYNGGETDPYSEGHVQIALTTMDDVVFAK